MRLDLRTLIAVLVLVSFGLAIGLFYSWNGMSVTEEEVQSAVITTLQQDEGQSFLVTGRLGLTATSTVSSEKTLMPEVLGLSLGTTQATVRLPGRVSYGFSLREIEAEEITVEGDTVTIRIPELQVQSVEPDLEAMQVQTEVGWARLYRSSGRRAEREAMRAASRVIREEATEYLATAAKPRENTEEAVRRMLRPTLEALGLEEPHVRVVSQGGIPVYREGG